MDRARAILVGLSLLLLAAVSLLVFPFIEFLLLAVLLAYPLLPLQRRLERRLDPRLTAGALVAATTVAVVLPVLWFLRIVIGETTTFIGQIRRGEMTFTAVEAWVYDVTGEEVDLMEAAQTGIRETGIGTVDGALGVFGTLTNLLIGVALTLFLLYYFLKDAGRFNQWLQATTPLPDHIYADLRREFDDVVWAVLVSHVFIAVVQGLVAGFGLIVLGIPSAVFWTGVMILLAVLPIIGSFLVWGPASIYLFSVGRPLAGGTLFVYGTVVVGLSDDFLRPLVIDRYTETRLNPGAIVIGIFGGVYLLGFIGIFFGPVVVGSLRAVLDVYRREYVEGGSEGRIETEGATAAVTEGTADSENAAGTTPQSEATGGEEATGTDRQPEPSDGA